MWFARWAIAALLVLPLGCQINEQSFIPEDAAPPGYVIVTPTVTEVSDEELRFEWEIVGDRKWVWGSADPDVRIRYSYPLGTTRKHGGKYRWFFTLRLVVLSEEDGRRVIGEYRTLEGDLPEAKTEPILSTYDRPILASYELGWDERPLEEIARVFLTEPQTLELPFETPFFELRYLDEQGLEVIRGAKLRMWE